MRLANAGVQNHPATPRYVYFSFVLLILALGSPLSSAIVRFFSSITNTQSAFSRNLLTTAIGTSVLPRENIFAYTSTLSPSRLKSRYLSSYFKSVTSRYQKNLFTPHMTLAGSPKLFYITWFPSAATPSSLYVLFLFFRTRERLFSRAFLILRYRLFV